VLKDSHTNIISFAESFSKRGEYVEAEAIYGLTLPLQEEILGEKHHTTITSKKSLAVLLVQQGKNAEAEAIYRE